MKLTRFGGWVLLASNSYSLSLQRFADVIEFLGESVEPPDDLIVLRSRFGSPFWTP
jgi:hypothetical protein